MKILKFRIKNYKSIVDSTDCYFSDNLTIFAGKNESGKTSILEALEDFHEDKKIRETSKPIKGGGIPEIKVSFILLKKEINELFKKIDINREASEDIELALIKKYETDGYQISKKSRKLLGFESIYTESKENIIKKVGELKLIDEENKVVIPKLEKQRLDEYLEELQTPFQNMKSIYLVAEKLEKINSLINDITTGKDSHYDREKTATDFITQFVTDKLPYFILFSSFEDEFPQSILMSELDKNEWAKDLENISEFNIEKIKSTNQQERGNHQRKVNIDFSDTFKEFWTQDDIKLEVERDGENINFWIIEDETQYFPSQRSKGQQWYLSFYIKIVSLIKEDKPNILLIDEPGLYLHAKAQKDLLQVLKKHSSNYPVIFSTHSPFLIETDGMESVRLVEKDKIEGSRVLGKLHAHSSADKETLTPILTAIGLGINDSITSLDQKNNVVVEGPSDTFYLQAFKKLLGIGENNINFINGGGAPNMGMVGSILEGWGANVIYLFDNDKGKKQGKKRLENWKVLPNLIKVIIDKDNSAIEDILSINDFKKYIFLKDSLKYKIKNSEYVIKNKKDKVLLARQFLQMVISDSSKIILDNTSEENIKKLFENIKFKS